MDDGRTRGIGLDDSVVVVEGDASKRGNQKTDSGGVVENQINRIGRTLILDDNHSPAFVGLSLGKQSDGGSTSRRSDSGVGMIKPFDKGARKLYE